MKSAEMVADVVLSQPGGKQIQSDVFDQYQRDMRQHESTVQKMVDAFYIASRNTSVQRMVTSFQGGYFTRKFVTFVGGDFHQNPSYVARVRIYSKIVGKLFGNDRERTPQNHPDYLHGSVPHEVSGPAPLAEGMSD